MPARADAPGARALSEGGAVSGYRSLGRPAPVRPRQCRNQEGRRDRPRATKKASEGLPLRIAMSIPEVERVKSPGREAAGASGPRRIVYFSELQGRAVLDSAGQVVRRLVGA